MVDFIHLTQVMNNGATINMILNGKNVLVTGGGGMVAQELKKLLVEEGALVTTSDLGNSIKKLFRTSAIRSMPIRSYNPKTPVFGIPIGLPKTASASSIVSFILNASVFATCIA